MTNQHPFLTKERRFYWVVEWAKLNKFVGCIFRYLYFAVDIWLLQNFCGCVRFRNITRLSTSSSVTPEVVTSSSSEIKERTQKLIEIFYMCVCGGRERGSESYIVKMKHEPKSDKYKYIINYSSRALTAESNMENSISFDIVEHVICRQACDFMRICYIILSLNSQLLMEKLEMNQEFQNFLTILNTKNFLKKK